jgi:NTP pyrophosphatase (non-canonical NTP hydrolase)
VILSTSINAVYDRAERSEARYGPIASSHEGLGVCLEEWDELRAAVQANDLQKIKHEALDLAAACLRLAEATSDRSFIERSQK